MSEQPINFRERCLTSEQEKRHHAWKLGRYQKGITLKVWCNEKKSKHPKKNKFTSITGDNRGTGAHTTMQPLLTIDGFKPIEGEPKKRRPCDVKSWFAKGRANHRNLILKDWAVKLEPKIEPQVPLDYVSPFDPTKCAYCLSSKLGKNHDEFRPISQRGRMNRVNCLPCCGDCNSKKQDKCGKNLLNWIKEYDPIPMVQKQLIISWWKDYEIYMLIPQYTFDAKRGMTYQEAVETWLDTELTKDMEKYS